MKFCQYQGCSYKHEWQSKINEHVEIVHKKKKENHCHHCQKSFGRSYNLRRHIEIVHKKKKETQCDHCQKSFGSIYNLGRHIEIVHRKQKIFDCQICQKVFSTKQNRDNHQQTVHQKIDFEEIVEDNEFVNSSLKICSEFENSKEKKDNYLQPIIILEQLSQAEIAIHRGGKKSQPFLILKKLKNIEKYLDKQNSSSTKKCQNTTRGKSQPKTSITTKNRKTFKYYYVSL